MIRSIVLVICMFVATGCGKDVITFEELKCNCGYEMTVMLEVYGTPDEVIEYNFSAFNPEFGDNWYRVVEWIYVSRGIKVTYTENDQTIDCCEMIEEYLTLE